MPAGQAGRGVTSRCAHGCAGHAVLTIVQELRELYSSGKLSAAEATRPFPVPAGLRSTWYCHVALADLLGDALSFSRRGVGEGANRRILLRWNRFGRSEYERWPVRARLECLSRGLWGASSGALVNTVSHCLSVQASSVTAYRATRARWCAAGQGGMSPKDGMRPSCGSCANRGQTRSSRPGVE